MIHQLLYPLPNDCRIGIIAGTTYEADKLFEELCVFKKNFFTKYTQKKKVSMAGQLFICTGIKTACSNLKGYSLDILIIHEDVDESEFPMLEDNLLAVYRSTTTTIMKYSDKEGFSRFIK